MKAWGCMDYNAECGVIVFAATQGKARSIAKGCAGLEDSEWCDIEVRRIKSLDGERTEDGDLDWYKDARLYYEAGWWSEDGARSCDCCGLYEYSEIPESAITETEEGDMCAACLLAEANTPPLSPIADAKAVSRAVYEEKNNDD